MRKKMERFDEAEMRALICEVGHRIWTREYIAANDGNLSVLLFDEEVLATPASVSKGFLTPEMLVVVDRNGNQLRGDLRPSSEIKMHLDFYRARPDIRAVVHAHPPTATGFAVAGIPLDRALLPEAVIYLGAVPLVKYGVPGTDELMHDILENYVRDFDAFLLANHGVTTISATLLDAYHKMEMVEHFAKISLVARQLGRENVFSPARAQELLDARARYGSSSRGGCRIETKEQHPTVTYAEEVPMQDAQSAPQSTLGAENEDGAR
jgi:L-fuculose-phosphate aldolase